MKGERGAAATEWVLLVPLVVLVLGVMVAGARLAWARTSVAEAAHAAARAASQQRSAALALAEGTAAGRANAAGLPCAETDVVVDVAGFRVPVGTPARVSARVSCRVPLGDLLVPGLPGDILVVGEGVAVLDAFRERS